VPSAVEEHVVTARGPGREAHTRRRCIACTVAHPHRSCHLSPHAQALAERNILKIQRSLEQGEVRALERDMSRQAKQVAVRAHCSAALEIVYMSGCLFDGEGESVESGEERRGKGRRGEGERTRESARVHE
jgi:hypothetical protein